MEDGGETVAFRAVSGDEEGRKRVEKVETRSHNHETLKHIEKKLIDKGVQRLDRHPARRVGGIGLPPPKSGRGGKYTWEGPHSVMDGEMEAAPAAIDENDPNYVEEEAAVEEDVGGMVVGEVEVAKVAEAREGVARVDVDPQLKDFVA